MHKLIISAPFGNYLRWPGTTPTLGTYTVKRRAWFWRRLWRVVKTVRYNWSTQSWVNKLGMPNPGILDLKDATGCILSIYGFGMPEWQYLVHAAVHRNPVAIEFNVSCPNVIRANIDEFIPGIELTMKYWVPLIVKLPPVKWMEYVKPLFSAGVRHFHLCNTIPSPGGGISGKPLKQFSLWAVQEVRDAFPDVTITGGGGVSDVGDVWDYVRAGADHVAVGSMLFNPFNWRRVPKLKDFLLLQGNGK